MSFICKRQKDTFTSGKDAVYRRDRETATEAEAEAVTETETETEEQSETQRVRQRQRQIHSLNVADFCRFCQIDLLSAKDGTWCTYCGVQFVDRCQWYTSVLSCGVCSNWKQFIGTFCRNKCDAVICNT